MARLTEAQRRDYPSHLDNIEAVLQLASANFPRTTEVRIETVGSTPQASMTVSWTILAFLIDAGRSALESEP
jgi:hypothetical protein